MSYHVNDKGYYGNYGGAFIPEMLNNNIIELKKAFYFYNEDDTFKKEYLELLKDYVGRPTPLYLAKNLSEKYDSTIY